tara:strand:- start:499 stop:696 length:198 start_codon:yes stop_codon:yes gene_type:complete
MADMIPSVGATIPTTTTRQDVVTKIFEGSHPGTTQIQSTVYNVTVYDINGKLQTVTNSHVINYTV